jgi:hypothetical protein
MKDYPTARSEAGSPRGIEYANRLAAMSPAEAADELFDMFALCADEDLRYDIAQDLELNPTVARQIAAEIIRKRHGIK